ncbi:MAG: 30S ribosomal protein S3, partial [Thermodesulfobacteriota bacterium]
MGQKVHPTSLRLGFIKNWDSRWYAEKDYPQLVIEDIQIRKFLKEKLYHAGVSKIEIERAASKAKKV